MSLFPLPYAVCRVEPCGGARSKLRTMSATRQPFIAPSHRKVGADRRKWPAIMQCPYNRDILLFYIIKKERDIYIASMQIVQMDHIGSIPVDLHEKVHRMDYGKGALPQRVSRKKAMHAAIQPITDCNRILTEIPNTFATSISRKTADPLTNTDIMDLFCNFAGTANAIHSVDL